MPRQTRIDAPGALHHIIARGIERRKIFKDNTDRSDFLDRLGKVLSETGTECFAWALIPNHFHILLRTGAVPVANVMLRLLTGYAVAFNLRHKRSGHLFQNRYKSVLCQEDTYLSELVRYIHLNPIRAGLVPNISELEKYPFSGHAVIMGEKEHDWQNTGYVLRLFHDKTVTARQRYRSFVNRGISNGKRPELTGGGLIRSSGGWEAVKSLKKTGIHVKSDERILGDSDFVSEVLQAANEAFERRYELKRRGYDPDSLAAEAAGILSVSPEEIFLPGKQPERVKARSLFCLWAVRELGFTMTEVAHRLKLTQPAVSISVRRGELIAKKEGHVLHIPRNL